jgi:protein-S-isoprenylcysteine O-methyltransferase Ste14
MADPAPGVTRGVGYVIAQFVLLTVIVILGLVGPGWQIGWVFTAVGAAVGLLGLAVAAAGMARLGPALTPMPRPLPGAPLSTAGVYGVVRHPIYSGVLIGSLGWCVASSPWALPGCAALSVLFGAKCRREERWLREAHPDGAYAEYVDEVRWRLLPGLW